MQYTGVVISKKRNLGIIEFDEDSRISFNLLLNSDIEIGDEVYFEVTDEPLTPNGIKYVRAVNLSKINRGDDNSTLSQNLASDNEQELSRFQREFLENYGRGTVVDLTIVDIINPSLIITNFFDGFIGKLAIQDISWSFPASQDLFKIFQKGGAIKCVVLNIDFRSNIVQLSQKFLTKPISDTVGWEMIERGSEFVGTIIEKLDVVSIVKLENEYFGLINNDTLDIASDEAATNFRILDKSDDSNLLILVPSTLDVKIEEEEDIEVKEEFDFIEEDLRSIYSFKKSILGTYATEDDYLYIKNCFELNPKLFTKEFDSKHPLYLCFEFNSATWESTFKQNAIPYFLEGRTHDVSAEKELLGYLSAQKYWIKLNARKNQDGDEKSEFSIYNEDVNFFGEVLVSKDKKAYKFSIKNFSFGHQFSRASSSKKLNAKHGSFLLNSKISILTPTGYFPVNQSQKEIYELLVQKNNCFEIVNRLKLESGEILRSEGKTLAIIDKFLEYQISLIKEQKENNFFVEKYTQTNSESGGVSILVNSEVSDAMEINEDTVVNVRVRQDSFKSTISTELVRLGDGVFSSNSGNSKINFYREVNLTHLKNGFYLDKRISTKQHQIQRGIIQDFLNKKIKIDHIESLLVNPRKIKTPVLSNITFINPFLRKTELEQPDNNQVKAVKKAVGNNNVFLIQGPPGTGKTTVIAEVVEQLVAKGEKILIAGQTHVAVDNVLEKIAKVPGINILRVGNPDKIAVDSKAFHIDNLIESYRIDFFSFLQNQCKLIDEYSQSLLGVHTADSLKEKFNFRINDLALSYHNNLRENFRHKHFQLISSLRDLTADEINAAFRSYEEWLLSVNNEIELLLKPLIYQSVDVVFATCIGIKTDKEFSESDFKFDTVIIDEAGKANIAESLVAIELAKQVILVGDQMQLPPYIDSNLIDETVPGSFPKSEYGSLFLKEEIAHALKTSFFEFLVNRITNGEFPRANIEMLNYQHRMHPNIGEFVSKSFYDSNVKMGSLTHLNRLELRPPFNKEVIFFDTSSSPDSYEQSDGFSAKNNIEAESISELILPELLSNNISPREIAIIAPYKSQVSNIKQYIKNSSRSTIKNIDVSTLDSFQGKEFDIIIFSFTRAASPSQKNKKVGFLDDARRLNVAFSRAKKKLILVGNAKTLVDTRSHFDGLFNYTGLFQNLVKLSKNEAIGNFVSITDFYDFTTPFEKFSKKYKNGQKVTARVKMVGLSKTSKKPFGLFVLIDGVSCLAPVSLMSPMLRNNVINFSESDEIEVRIKEIDQADNKVTVMILEKDEWTAEANKLQRNTIYTVKVEKSLPYGYLLVMESGLTGLLHFSKISSRAKFNESDFIKVKVSSIDFRNKKLYFEFN